MSVPAAKTCVFRLCATAFSHSGKHYRDLNKGCVCVFTCVMMRLMHICLLFCQMDKRQKIHVSFVSDPDTFARIEFFKLSCKYLGRYLLLRNDWIDRI